MSRGEPRGTEERKLLGESYAWRVVTRQHGFLLFFSVISIRDGRGTSIHY